MILVLLYVILLLVRRLIGTDVETQGRSLTAHVTINVSAGSLAA
jgi:hypothetical protein